MQGLVFPASWGGTPPLLPKRGSQTPPFPQHGLGRCPKTPGWWWLRCASTVLRAVKKNRPRLAARAGSLEKLSKTTGLFALFVCRAVAPARRGVCYCAAAVSIFRSFIPFTFMLTSFAGELVTSYVPFLSVVDSILISLSPTTSWRTLSEA